MADLSPSYSPKEVEAKWYKFWKEKNLFNGHISSKKKAFSIVIPPPNVTGVLHMGHALDETLQDILIRFKRMEGFDALWIPGTDHAGISTQTVVEKHLIATQGKRRTDFSREEFLKIVWQWKEEKQKNILEQLEKVGSSCDWSYLRFTLDEQCSLAVKTVFKKMFDDGLIYRGDYLVNWDPVTQTAIADDEVEWEEKNSFLWYFRYPLKNSQKHIVIATTRPETMLGDTAVAVSPKDPRYADLVGQEIMLPLTGRTIPIIADSFVEPDFGSGALKITPAHDFNDHAIGTRHNLPIINIMNGNGTINQNGGAFAGLSMLDARQKIVEKMKALGLLEKIEPYKLRFGVSYRSKAVVEPYLSKQWFVKITGFKDILRSLVQEQKVKIIPKQWEETYFHWIDNLRDWCISRQLWWGHRIPIWYNKKNPSKMICHIEEKPPKEVLKNPDDWKQEEDVLDTWFSSALWPFSTLGWPKKTPEMKKFFPTSILITGHDILFFWVARMILMSWYAVKKVPFHKTFLHGLIYGKSYWRQEKDGSVTYASKEEKLKYDLGGKIPAEISSKWEKMSKSKGNVIDPLEIIEKYGTDAMRLALTSTVTHASQIDLDLRRFDEFKNFTNKIWNGARFVLQNLADLSKEALAKGLKKELFTIEDLWILSKLNRTIQKERGHLENLEFDKAAMLPYDFFWNDFCAYYLELVKPVLFGKELTPEIRENKQKLLLCVLLNTLRLLHPITPFITEELFQILKNDFDAIPISPDIDPYMQDTLATLQSQAMIIASYPKTCKKDISPKTEKTFDFLSEIVRLIRNIRTEMKVPPQEKTDLYFYTKEKKTLKILKDNLVFIKALVKTDKIIFVSKEKELPKGSSALLGKMKIILPMSLELIEQEKQRLIKEKAKIDSQIEGLKSKIENPDFLSKAPEAVVAKMKTNFTDLQSHSQTLKEKINQL